MANMSTLVRWFLGALLSFAIVWGSSAVFINSIPIWEYSDELDSYIFEENMAYRWRSEGWATSRVGRHDVFGIDDITTVSGRCVAIWGDSYVEAAQVADSEKTAQQLTKMFERENVPLTGIGIGRAGRSVSDYYYLLPRYEQLISPLSNVILISQIEDLEVDGKTFVQSPEFHFQKRNQRYQALGLRKLLSDWRLDFIFSTIKEMKTPREWVFLPWKDKAARGKIATVVDKTMEERRAQWQFALKSLQANSKAPLTIAYVPTVPFINDGEIIFQDENEALALELQSLASELGIGWVDLTSAFNGLYTEKGLFPRGFINSRPASGHLNKYGHYLLAREIRDYVMELR